MFSSIDTEKACEKNPTLITDTKKNKLANQEQKRVENCLSEKKLNS